MRYMTFEQQIEQHLGFLQKAGLDVKNLVIDAAQVTRSRADGELGRGEYAYKTVSRRLNNGMIGLMTWCRSEKGQINTYKTYGHPSDTIQKPFSNWPSAPEENTPIDTGKIRRFWELSSQHGVADYLLTKGVGAYHIRFRDNQYGRVAVVPMRDILGTLQGYQLLNPNGSKVFAKGIQLAGLFHQLTELANGTPIGIAESYVTAASCLELVGMPMVTAFSSDNLTQVALALQQRYPDSPLVLFADNDRHLKENKGVISAVKALQQVKNGTIVAPCFDGYPQTRAYSDWNDLVRVCGPSMAFMQIYDGLNGAHDGIWQWLQLATHSDVEF